MSTTLVEPLPAYQPCLGEALKQSPLMIERWCLSLADILYARAIESPHVLERRQLHESTADLKLCQSALERLFKLELIEAMAQDLLPRSECKVEGARSLSSISFDDLELMGDNQIQQTIDGARLQQILAQTCQSELAGFLARISAAQGYQMVQPDKNPLRPEIVARVLLKAMGQLQAGTGSQSRWLNHGAQLLGIELGALYLSLTTMLTHQGVAPASYGVNSASGDKRRRVGVSYTHLGGSGNESGIDTNVFLAQGGNHVADRSSTDTSGKQSLAAHLQVRQPHLAGGSLGSRGGRPHGSDEASGQVSRQQLLTLDRLHRLMAGNYDESFKNPPPESSFDFDDVLPRNEFSHTVPAAMDVLAELKQKGITHRQRKDERAEPPQPVALMREQFKTGAKSLGQSLAIEVVGLMIEQLTNDTRLLAPVRQVIANSEPAFLRLAITDPRFFSDKSHPARRLLEVITAKSLAYSSEEATGFAGFMLDLQLVAETLTEEHASDALHFATLLEDFEARQTRRSQQGNEAQQQAVQALLQAELRNSMAEKIAAEIIERPDFIAGNRVIHTFLTGPWAQVMAKERLQQAAGPVGSPRAVYSLTLGEMLWSMNEQEASRHRKRLSQLIPPMLSSVREGLMSIDYPLAESKPFYDELMIIHQRALKSSASTPVAAERIDPRAHLARAFEAGDSARHKTWIAPTEAQQSGFMVFDELDEVDGQTNQTPEFQATQPYSAHSSAHSKRSSYFSDDDGADSGALKAIGLRLNDWVELHFDNRWLRAQLTWISPRQTLFMFSGEGGRSHSMTVRMLQQLLRMDMVRIVSQKGVLDGALDNVARTAVRNSVDTSVDFEPSKE